MTTNSEIAFGDILTIGALLLTVLTIAIAWRRDRSLRQKEYSAPIRRSAGSVIAKIERWESLAIRFFDEIQPLLTDADVMLVEKKDITVVRDALWRNLFAARASYNQKILDEQIEIAYADLYGYDLKIQALFSGTMEHLQSVDRAIFRLVSELTQLQVRNASEPFLSGQLGNSLRTSISIISVLNKYFVEENVFPFRTELTKLINASDRELVNKRINIAAVENILPKTDYEGIAEALLEEIKGPKGDINKRFLILCENLDKKFRRGASLARFLENISAKETTFIVAARKKD